MTASTSPAYATAGQPKENRPAEVPGLLSSLAFGSGSRCTRAGTGRRNVISFTAFRTGSRCARNDNLRVIRAFIYYSVQLEIDVTEHPAGGIQLGRLTDVGVPAFDRSIGLADLEHVEPPVPVVELDEHVATPQDRVAEVADVDVELGTQDDAHGVAAEHRAIPRVG